MMKKIRDIDEKFDRKSIERSIENSKQIFRTNGLDLVLGCCTDCGCNLNLCKKCMCYESICKTYLEVHIKQIKEY